MAKAKAESKTKRPRSPAVARRGKVPHLPADTMYVTKRKAWRSWLRRNARCSSHVWLVPPPLDAGLPRISYNDAVEEALCFGWID
eukprot:gene2087-6476_t